MTKATRTPGDGLFGNGWSLGMRDVAIQTDIESTGSEDLGIYGPLASQTKLYLTLPSGESAGRRVAFQRGAGVCVAEDYAPRRPLW